MARARELYVQCLPVPSNPQSSFYQHQLQVRADVVSQLNQRGVKVVERFNQDSPPAVLVLFQSTGRIGDELPAALRDLDRNVGSQVMVFAAIQDNESGTVRRDAMPGDFHPDCLVDFCVVPGTTQLKRCDRNNESLGQVVQLTKVQVAGDDSRSNCMLCDLLCGCCPCMTRRRY